MYGAEKSTEKWRQSNLMIPLQNPLIRHSPRSLVGNPEVFFFRVLDPPPEAAGDDVGKA